MDQNKNKKTVGNELTDEELDQVGGGTNVPEGKGKTGFDPEKLTELRKYDRNPGSGQGIKG